MAQLPGLAHILLVGDEGGPTDIPGTQDLATLMGAAADRFDVERTLGTNLGMPETDAHEARFGA